MTNHARNNMRAGMDEFAGAHNKMKVDLEGMISLSSTEIKRKTSITLDAVHKLVVKVLYLGIDDEKLSKRERFETFYKFLQISGDQKNAIPGLISAYESFIKNAEDAIEIIKDYSEVSNRLEDLVVDYVFEHDWSKNKNGTKVEKNV